MKLIIQIVLLTLALLVVEALFPSIAFDDFWAALVTACLLTIFNKTVKPLLHILSLPLTILTFGIFALVINAIIFYLTAWLLPGFTIGSFWGAFFGAIAVSIINGIFVMLAKTR